jgi:hypothetical protein
MAPVWIQVAVFLLAGSAVLVDGPTNRARDRVYPAQLLLAEYKPPRGPREDCFGRCRSEVTKCKQYAHATWGGVQRAFLINLSINATKRTALAARAVNRSRTTRRGHLPVSRAGTLGVTRAKRVAVLRASNISHGATRPAPASKP